MGSRNMQKLDAPPGSYFSKTDSPPGPSPRVSFDLERQDPKKSLRSKRSSEVVLNFSEVALDAALLEVGDDVLDSLESPEIVIEGNSPVSTPTTTTTNTTTTTATTTTTTTTTQPAGETGIERIRRKKAARAVKPPVRQPIGSFKT